MRIELPIEELAAARDALPAGGKKLTGIAVYVAIAELAAEGLEATNDSIAERAGASSATVYNYLEPLVAAGVVQVEKRERGPWLYRPRAVQAAGEEALRRQVSAMRGLLGDLGVTPAQIAAREGTA
jgi:predicted transcriptional regulator